MIIVHRKQLLEQWIERIETFLGIPKIEIGKIGQGKNKAGTKITIATIQSLSKIINISKGEKLQTAFGTIIVDECHHVPAETFRNTISKLHCFYLYGLTATPFRKYNDGKLIFCHLGEMIAEIKAASVNNSGQVKIIIRNTMLDVPFNSKTDSYELLSKILVHDSVRNKLILDDVQQELQLGKKVVIITERKEHIDSLYQYLKQSFETITLSGDDSESTRAAKWKILKEGNYQVLITTGQLFGEGTDLQNANCLFLVCPFSFKGKLIQYIGRVQRSEIASTIYDYRDIKIDYLDKLFLKRNTYYRKIEKQASLFDEPTEEVQPKPNILTIEKKIKVPIELLEFHYGSVAFKHDEETTKSTLEFEIENLELRPEFEVLKPYFEKFMKSKSVSINIYAEFENKKIVAQNASSKDIDAINREVVEGVKFRFLTRIFTATQSQDIRNNLLSADQLQEAAGEIYNDGNEILEDILKRKDFKHSKHLQYLAGRHDGKIMKIRFALSPFSFVFLLSGLQQNHIILETLDTEEATYLWHVDKSKQALMNKVKEIDEQLGIIRNKGRQVFLQSNPENFSRVLHDYSAERIGFVMWKGLIEEQIV